MEQLPSAGPAVSPVPAREAPSQAPSRRPSAAEPDEVLTPATVTAPERVSAGAEFSVAWTGPDNRGDYVTIVRSEAPPAAYASYVETKSGK